MKKQAFNPYLPSWEYIPDGEPHVFGDRVYVYGSHDRANGAVFCLGDYVCYSASIDDLSDWRYEGVIYCKEQDKANDGRMVLYAPDVTQGSDGRYYLYYVYDKISIVSVAVCDTPAGKYEFYGYVHYKDGTRLGERKGDMAQFDPAVLTEGKNTYLYTAFCGQNMTDRIGAMATVLDEDMLTIKEEPVVIVPSCLYSLPESEAKEKAQSKAKEIACPYKLDSVQNWAGYKNHAFFEASSIRKINDKYYFVYSSEVCHELCYATSDKPTGDFVYGGVIVSNCDLGIDSYKKADVPVVPAANNHGGIVKIKDDYYIFYHRHTNNTWFSRQGCAEKIHIDSDGKIKQAEITSCGLNGGALKAEGEYGAYLACHIFTDEPTAYVTDLYPHITQDGSDNDDGSPFGVEHYDGTNGVDTSYIAYIKDKTTIGWKYFDFKGVKKVCVKARGYFHGYFEVKNSFNGEVLGKIELGDTSDFWEERCADIAIPDGVSAFYLTFSGSGTGQLKSIRFEC